MNTIVIIMAVAALSITAIAFQSGGSWLRIVNSTNDPFWTADQQLQSCGALNSTSGTCTVQWLVNATGFGKYNLSVRVYSTDLTDLGYAFPYFNMTIFDKGNNSASIPNYSCTGCAFQIINGTGTDTRNPLTIGELNNNGTTIMWNISALGPMNSTWDLLINATYSSSTGTNKKSNITKVRIVDYPWWNTSWNCRRLINVTQNTANSGAGVVEVRNFQPVELYTDDSCRAINCTKELRVTEILSNNNQQFISNISIDQETTTNYKSSTFCNEVRLRFNTTLATNQTKQFFVYFDNPVTTVDYSQIDASQNTISNNSYLNMQKFDEERIWDLFYDSHVNLYWEGIGDSKSIIDKDNASLVKRVLEGKGYKPQNLVNRRDIRVTDRLPFDNVFWYAGHGGIFNNSNGIYNTFEGHFLSQAYLRVTPNNISNISQNLNTKLVMIKVSFGGDNSTTLTGCSLTSWLSKAFVDKGADCYLSFLGNNNITDCTGNCDINCPSDSIASQTGAFNDCFWRNISVGATIRNATFEADKCAKTCGNGTQSCTNPILVERYSGACDQILIK